MINKYAEIQDRILLYNACKGILRVKMAAYYNADDLGGLSTQELADIATQPDAKFAPEAQAIIDRERPAIDNFINNPNTMASQQTAPAQPQQQQAPADSNAQQQGTSLTSYVPGAIGAVGGGIGGGYLGNKATGWLNKKLGLTKDRGGWRKWLGRGIQTAGTVGGGLTGMMLGNNITNGLAGGWSTNSLENAKQRAAQKAQRQAEIEQAAQQAVEPQS